MLILSPPQFLAERLAKEFRRISLEVPWPRPWQALTTPSPSGPNHALKSPGEKKRTDEP